MTLTERLEKMHNLVKFLAYGVPRALKCARCRLGDHCNGEDDDCLCECIENSPRV